MHVKGEGPRKLDVVSLFMKDALESENGLLKEGFKKRSLLGPVINF